MKPLGFSLAEMRELLQLLDEAEDAADKNSQGSSCERLAHFTEMVDERCRRLEDQLSAAVEFADMLREQSGTCVAVGRGGSRADKQ
jgi:DNA-binding transcriptional MerR regulator